MNKKEIVLIVIAGLLWGTSGIFVHYLSPYGFTPMQMIAMRGSVSGTVMALYALIFNRKLFKISVKGLLLSVLSGAAMYACGLSYYASMQASSVSTAVVLMYTSPIIVMVFSVIFFKERLSLIKGIAVSCMLVGCVLVSGIFGGGVFNLAGVALGLLAGFAYSAYNIFTKMQMQRGFNPVSCSMYCFITYGVFGVAFGNPVGIVNTAAENPSVILLAVGIGIATSVIPYFLYTLSLRKLPVGTASALGIFEPVSATAYSVAFLGEKLTLMSLSGIILVVGAVVLISKSE